MSDLIERQAAIDVLEREKTYCTAYRDGYSPINVFEKYNAGLTDGIKALKNLPSAQPERNCFHVIDNKTGKEADTYEIALHEKWAKDLMYCDMEGFAIEEDGSLILTDECGVFVFCDPERFKVVWDE